jgi:tRNA threonylcarbamoyladenosine biosynthesis protein TsaE
VVVDEAGLAEWARRFARDLRPPAAVGISGELGTGKTTLVRALADALGARGPVTSPTFALVQTYRGRGLTVHHVDAYRLKAPAEGADLALDEMAADPEAVLLIEWPERLGGFAPRLTHRLKLRYADRPDRRVLESV